MTTLRQLPISYFAYCTVGLVLLAGPASVGVSAQGKGQKPLKLLVAAGAKEPAAEEEEPRIVLRPNPDLEQPFRLFLLNPGPGVKKNLKVRVLPLTPEGKVGGDVLTATVPLLVAENLTPIKFDKRPPQEGKESKGKEAKEVRTGLNLPGPPFRLRVEAEDAGKTIPFEVPVLLQSPRQYTEVTRPAYDEEKRRLTIKIKVKDPQIDPEVPVALELPAALIPGLQPAEAGRREGVLDRRQPQVELTAEGINFKGPRPNSGRIYLTVDGYERAYLFAGTFAPGVPQLLDTEKPRVRIVMPHYFEPAKVLSVPVQVDALLGEDLEVELAYRQIGNETFTPLRPLRGFRQQTVQAGSNEEGQLLLRARVQDWDVPIRTAGITGRLEIRVRLLDLKGNVVALTEEIDLERETASLFRQGPASRYSPSAPLRFDRGQNALFAEVVLDATTPEIVLGGLPTATAPKKALRPTARALRGEDQAPVDYVVFYLGDAVKDRKSLPRRSVEGALVDPERGIWEAKEDLLIPEDQKERVIVNVLATTLADRVGTQATILRVGAVAPDDGKTVADAKIKPGEISGKILRGGRPQPKATVTLMDGKGAVKATSKPDTEGRYKFKDLEPGTYTVFAAQPALQTEGRTVVTVPDGKDRRVQGADISLLARAAKPRY
jgi:hypothetical protein